MKRRNCLRRYCLGGTGLLACGVLFMTSSAMLPASTAGAGVYTHPQNAPVSIQDDIWYTSSSFSGTESNMSPRFNVESINWRIHWSAQPESEELSVFNFFVYQSEPFIQRVSSMLDDHTYPDNTLYITSNGEQFYLKVIAANINNWQIEVQEQIPSNVSPVRITHIQYLGTERKSYAPLESTASNDNTRGSGYFDYGENGPVCQYKNEPDEYVVITNTSQSWIDIGGWTLRNITRGYPCFTFPHLLSTCPPYLDNYYDCGNNCVPPAPCMLGPHQSFRIYTDEINPASGGFTFNYGPGDMWDNESPQTAVLYDSNGNEISRLTYNLFSDPADESPVRISRIYYKGAMSADAAGELSEADEYVVIRNTTGCFQDLSGWKLINENREFPVFIFPQRFYLCPFESVRVYTNEVHPEWDGLCSTYNAGKLLFDYYDEVHNRNEEKCTFFPVDEIHQGSHLSFNYEKGNIWNNTTSDTAALYNSKEDLMDRKSYIILPSSNALLEKE